MRIVKYFLSLFFPNYCLGGCGNTLEMPDEQLCVHCFSQLTLTHFSKHSPNNIEQLFWGKVRVERATSLFYFSKESRIQQIIHQLKYKGRNDIGFLLGRLLGKDLIDSPDFDSIDLVIPVPLHKSKKNKRGYNQSEEIAKGVIDELKIPLDTKSLKRISFTKTQTRKKRFERWENVKDVFSVQDSGSLEGKHILLIDDVCTTGATLIACAEQLLTIKDVKISIATVAFAS